MEERHPAAPRLGRGEPPMHAGLSPTFCGQPLVLDPDELEGVDVAVVGAPFDDGTSNRPGARFGPRAIRAWDDEGRYGRAAPALRASTRSPCSTSSTTATPSPRRATWTARTSSSPACSAASSPRARCRSCSAATTRSRCPTLRVLAERFGADGYAVVHFDTHADTGAELYGVRISHGTPFRVAVEEGALLGANIVQIGLRGTWPGPEDFAWMREQGFRWHTMDEIDERGLDAVARRRARPRRRPRAARLPHRRHRRARPGLRARHRHARARRPDDARAARARCAASAARLDLCAADVVEVCPPFDPTGITALAGERAALDILTGMAMRRRG